jgi:hypothetical protein
MLNIAYVAITLALLSTPTVAAPSVETFDPPGSVQTQPVSINAAGTIVGSFVDINEIFHGFVRFADGRIERIGVPPGSPPNFVNTQVTGINDNGDIIGFCSGRDINVGHGFIGNHDGTILTFPFLYPDNINKDGTVVGFKRLTEDTNDQAFERFANGKILRLTIMPPTYFDQISNDGSILGQYLDSSRREQYFIRSAIGKIRLLKLPGIRRIGGASMNDNGTVTGIFTTNRPHPHGFVKTAAGVLTIFDPAGSALTDPTAINNAGWITGYYEGPKGVTFGFIRAPAGAITSFGVPNADTIPSAINAAGVITGQAVIFGRSHGFVRSAP